MTLSTVLTNLKDRIPFSFVRFADGEFICVYGFPGVAMQMKRYGRDVVKWCIQYLKPMIEEPQPYSRNVQQMSLRDYPAIHKYVDGWGNADILHKMSEMDGIDVLLDALKDRKVLLVGPEYMAKMGWDMVVVPFDKRPTYNYQDVKKRIADVVHNYDVILYACSFIGKRLLHDFYTPEITQIDTGALFDPYCGVFSRKYMQQMKDRFEQDN